MQQETSRASFNRRWATLLLEALTRHDVQHICIAPGSRSAPLTLAAAANEKLTCHTHFDERGLGFFALGLAKQSRQPVAIIVTSGTAVANLYPAIVEAHLTGERLIAITADRPPELIDCGANQAIEQVGIFGSHISASLNLPRPTPEISARWLVSRVDTLLAQQYGAAHINCPFAEPLYGADSDEYQAWHDALGDWWQSRGTWLDYPQHPTVTGDPDWDRWRQKRGVVVAGRLTAQQGVQVAEWAAALGWPLIGDVVSHSGQPLPGASLWLAHPQAQQWLNEADIVVQFGSSLTGKNLLHFQAHCRVKNWWLVDELPGQRNPAHARGRRIQAPVSDWLQQHPALVRTPWCPQLQQLAAQTQDYLQQHLQSFGEAQMAHRLAALLPDSGALFIGNSLAIRLVDAFAQLPAGYPVYCNRGASGIDGLLATAAGVQRTSGQPLLVILGDLSALYDINSLALFQQASAPVVIVVVNNQGGQIFSLLPGPESGRSRFFTMPPRVDFSHAAALFGLRFQQPADWEALKQAVASSFASGVTLIELRVDGDEGAQALMRCASEVAQL